MKKRLFVCLGMLMGVLVALTGCKDDSVTAGSSLLGDRDVILVKADTFSLSSGLVPCGNIITAADSFLLGEIETDYGTMRAEIFSQLACPVGYSFPETAEIDSVCLFMYYRAWVGSGTTPMLVNIYEIDGNVMDYSATYTTDVEVSDYCSMDESTLLVARQPLVVAGNKHDSVYNSSTGTYQPMVRCRINDDFAQRFFTKRAYTSQEDFNSFFKGLYITPTFGSATVLHITDISMAVYYHFSYRKGDRDTTVNDMKGFYANSEVRHLNRIEYRDKDALVDKLLADSAHYNYVIAPAGIYTRMQFPMAQIKETIMHNLVYKDTVKRPYVNLAQLRVDVLNVFDGSESDIQRNDWLQPAPYMLLIKENSLDRFFYKKELPNDTVAILSALTNGVDSLGNTVYYYSYDLNTLLTNQIRHNVADTLSMLLVPVTVETTTASSGATAVTSVRQSQVMSATKIRSADKADAPTSLQVVYSGF